MVYLQMLSYDTIVAAVVGDAAINIAVPVSLLEHGGIGRRDVASLIERLNRAISKLQEPK